jgi:4-hydroxy-tetrahydrodipicolinate reductase
MVKSSGIGMVYADNFSLGMNLFYRLIDYAGKIMDKVKEYEAFGFEMHHRFKADSPSGTARVISDIMLNNLSRKSSVQFERLNRPIRQDEFHFVSLRGGNIPGVHCIGFDSDADTIELKHTARNRNGFAVGALLAANMINGKTGLYSFRDIFDQLVG